jgi:hypothetical protein
MTRSQKTLVNSTDKKIFFINLIVILSGAVVVLKRFLKKFIV